MTKKLDAQKIHTDFYDALVLLALHIDERPCEIQIFEPRGNFAARYFCTIHESKTLSDGTGCVSNDAKKLLDKYGVAWRSDDE